MAQRPGRRAFLRRMAASSALLASARGLAMAEVPADEEPAGRTVPVGVVGLGPWGREILATLARMRSVRVAAVCDTYAPALKKAAEIAPGAAPFTDVHALLGAPGVEAVVVATPAHRHREVALAALEAGRHVYCEAPLAATLDDARAIARAALAAGTVFQGGVQGRANALYRHVAQFVKSGVLGTPLLVSAQWGRKDSWRRVAPTPAREEELNWRLASATSPGLAGEVGLHLLDLAAEYLGGLPLAVSGHGAIALWKDGRDVPDTVQCALEYPRGLRVTLDATLGSSAGGSYVLFRGSNSSLMVREKRAWLIKEADSPLLGWEVYARKDNVLDETGIALVADATKILAAGEEPGRAAAEPAKEALRLALESFAASVRSGSASACGPREAFRATVVALQAEASARGGTRVELSPAEFEIA